MTDKNQQTIIQELVTKTMQELSTPKKPESKSRTWQDPEGYQYLVQWTNPILLRYLIRLLTNSLPKAEYRRKSQLDDAARSVVRNVEEGFKRSTTAHYLEFIGFSQGSLEEVKGDIRELTEDGFLPSKPGSNLASIGINLAEFHNALSPLNSAKGPLEDTKGKLKENTGFNYVPLTVLYPPLAQVKATDLTYEIFIELINKTDWLLRKLVESLEKKLTTEQKYYQVEQARIKGKLKDY